MQEIIITKSSNECELPHWTLDDLVLGERNFSFIDIQFGTRWNGLLEFFYSQNEVSTTWFVGPVGAPFSDQDAISFKKLDEGKIALEVFIRAIRTGTQGYHGASLIVDQNAQANVYMELRQQQLELEGQKQISEFDRPGGRLLLIEQIFTTLDNFNRGSMLERLASHNN